MRIFSKFLLILVLTSSLILSREPVRSKNGMVVSSSEYATSIGVEIIKKGGNAIDAAVAVGFALSVSLPSAGNIGGGGFMVLHLNDGNSITIDFRETAPILSHRNMFLNEDGTYSLKNSTSGGKSVGVPGTVDGLLTALEKYGTMSLKEVIQPAIDLANNGFIIKHQQAAYINYFNEVFNQYESTKKILTVDGSEIPIGHILVQKNLARTLEIIKENGRDGFYTGEIAEKIISQVKSIGGIMSLNDLKNYKSIIRKPITEKIGNYEIISMPPPSSGGIALIQTIKALSIIDEFNESDWGSSEYYHHLTEILKQVYADRSKHLGDPDFYNVPVKELTSDLYCKKLINNIKYVSRDADEIRINSFIDKESDQTTHYSVADKFGNAVSVTYTLNSSFGNKVIVEGAGFLLNNEMDDFSSKPGEPNQFGLLGSEANSIAPKKRMLSSMTPTIVLRNNKPYILAGGRGGSKIITAVTQVIINVMLFNMNIQDAVDSPRIHHQWYPDRIDYEKFAISNDVMNNLIKRNHTIGIIRKIANVEAILIDENNIFWGATDPRGYGKAEGF